MAHEVNIKTIEMQHRGIVYQADFYVDGGFLRANIAGRGQSIMCGPLPAEELMLALLAERIMELDAMPPPQKRRSRAAPV